MENTNEPSGNTEMDIVQPSYKHLIQESHESILRLGNLLDYNEIYLLNQMRAETRSIISSKLDAEFRFLHRLLNDCQEEQLLDYYTILNKSTERKEKELTERKAKEEAEIQEAPCSSPGLIRKLFSRK